MVGKKRWAHEQLSTRGCDTRSYAQTQIYRHANLQVLSRRCRPQAHPHPPRSTRARAQPLQQRQ
eukprot:6194424-Pleurochrysis_carterae.AAC.1